MSDEERAKWIAERIYEEQDHVCGSDDIAVAARHIAAAMFAVRAEEREACAKLVEDADVKTYGGFYDNDNGQATLDGAAAAIRARGQS